MKPCVKRCIDMFARNPWGWKWINSTLLPAAHYAAWARASHQSTQSHPEEDLVTKTTAAFPDMTVQHGPFKGMKYPEAESHGSALFPKLLGSYERELHPWIERICALNYTEIVDVGCAEGYYAIGLAMRMPQTKVYAFDINERALGLCRAMAELNGVNDNLSIHRFCDANGLMSIPVTSKGLVICDCEGYEAELITQEVANSWQHWDFLIELHDFQDINISSHIRSILEKTHRIEMVESVDDIKKAKTYEYDELAGYDLRTRKRLLAEHRHHLMEWLLAIGSPHRS